MLAAAANLLDARGRPLDLQAIYAEETTRSVAIGGAGTSIFSGNIDTLEPNSEVKGALWYGSPGRPGIVQKMVRDPHVRKSLGSIVGNLLQGIWDFVPAKASGARIKLANEIADLCRWQFFELIDWAQVLMDQLKCLRDGFSIHEFTDDARAIDVERFPLHPGNGIGVVYTGFHHRPAWTISRWIQSKTNTADLDGVVQYLRGSDAERAGEVTIPASRLIRATQEQEGADYQGFALLRSAYGAWKSKVVLTIVQMILHERTGSGLPGMTLPAGVSPDSPEVTKARSILEQIRSHEKGYVILPNGWSFSWNTNDGLGGVAQALEAAIERCNRDIAHNVGAVFMLLGSGTSANGSYALAQTQKSQSQIDQEVFAHFILRVWNRGMDGWSPVKRFVRMNYGADAAEHLCPTMVVKNLPSREWAGVLPLLKQLVDAKVIVADEALEDWARVNLNAPAREGPRPDLAAKLENVATSVARFEAMLPKLEKMMEAA